MANFSTQDEITFKVRCVWCNLVIRPDTRKDVEAMCLDCYRRMLNEYICPAQEQPDQARFASER